MDWKTFLWGKKPTSIFEYERVLRNTRLLMWVFVVVSIFILFGVLQQKAEVNNCWDELNVYRMADSVLGGVPVSNCFIDGSGLLICNDDLSSIT